MTSDQLGENNPRLETVLAKSQKLPSSDDELAQCIHRFAHIIRSSFNDYALNVGTDSDSAHIPGINRVQPIRIPPLGDTITFFRLEDGVEWGHLGPIEEITDQHEVPTVRRSFEGFDSFGKRLFTGIIQRDRTFDEPGIGSFEEWRRESYGSSCMVNIHKFAVEGTKNVYMLYYQEPIEPGIEIIDMFGLKYTDRRGVRCATSYDGTLVKRSRWLTYRDEVNKYNLGYHIPFFRRGKDALTKSDVENAFNQKELLYKDSEYLQDSDLRTFFEEIDGSDKIYHSLKSTLGLDKLHWYEEPMNILRLVEIAQYLENKYRHSKGLPEILYRDYSERIESFKKHLWRSFTGFDPNWKPPIEAKSWGYSVSSYQPQCLYPDIAFPGDLCLRKCGLKFCPRGLGPFDPGPHNPSAPNDPRGRDPRGLFDPRGPR